MKLRVNGEEYELTEAEPTVRTLVQKLGLGDQAVAVEVNSQLVPKRDHETTTLQEGDTVEVVTLVGGG
jgi:thiamine biosynthesis protein ThiS